MRERYGEIKVDRIVSTEIVPPLVPYSTLQIAIFIFPSSFSSLYLHKAIDENTSIM